LRKPKIIKYLNLFVRTQGTIIYPVVLGVDELRSWKKEDGKMRR